MQRFLIGLTVVILLGAALAFSAFQPARDLDFPADGPNPVSGLKVNQHADDFQFAIVSDRTGGHRDNVFAQAVEKLNLLQPAFVLSVGDLIEGGNKKPKQLEAEWREFDGLVNRLQMPFYYVAGNHDVAAASAAKFWEGKLGRKYYHFVYRNVLFLILNSDDPAGSNGNIGKEQQAYAQKVLEEKQQVRWTIVVVHRPLWSSANVAKNGWAAIETALKDRRYTVFAGHVHSYKKFVRNGQNYYQLATTGGGSQLRGPEYGEFDQIAWVTMKKDGPLLANVMIEAVLTEDLKRPATNEPVARKKGLHAVAGRAFVDGNPLGGAHVLLTPVNGSKGKKAFGIVQPDGTFQLTTGTAHDGAMEGEYRVTVSMKKGKETLELLPAMSEFRATIRAGNNDLLLDLKKSQ